MARQINSRNSSVINDETLIISFYTSNTYSIPKFSFQGEAVEKRQSNKEDNSLAKET